MIFDELKLEKLIRDTATTILKERKEELSVYTGYMINTERNGEINSRIIDLSKVRTIRLLTKEACRYDFGIVTICFDGTEASQIKVSHPKDMNIVELYNDITKHWDMVKRATQIMPVIQE